MSGDSYLEPKSADLRDMVQGMRRRPPLATKAVGLILSFWLVVLRIY